MGRVNGILKADGLSRVGVWISVMVGIGAGIDARGVFVVCCMSEVQSAMTMCVASLSVSYISSLSPFSDMWCVFASLTRRLMVAREDCMSGGLMVYRYGE